MGRRPGRDREPRARPDVRPVPSGGGTLPRDAREREGPHPTPPPAPAPQLEPCAPGRAELGNRVGAPAAGHLEDTAPAGLTAHLLPSSVPGSRASSGGAAGDSFVVSAYSSGRKGTVEAERRGGVEHRARDKQVGVTGWS